MKAPTPKRVLGVFTLAMLNIAAVASLRTLPIMANCGLTLFFFYIVAALAFFIPSGLVAAELATAFCDKEGGLYAWIKEAFGTKCGFFAIWCLTAKGFAYFPVALAFVAGAMAFLINPHLAESRTYTVGVILALMWLCTFINARGLKAADLISTVGSLLGTIIPGLLIVALGVYWLLSGRPCEVDFGHAQSYWPAFNSMSELTFLAGTFIGFGGLELSAVNIRDTENPQSVFPKAIALSSVAILGLMILGTLAIVMVVPQGKLSLDAGVMQAFSSIFQYLGLPALTPWMAVLVAGGAIATVKAWLIGPIKGLHATSATGDIPPWLQKTNAHGMPMRLLYLQAAVVSLFAMAFLVMPSVNSAFWLLTTVTANAYMAIFLMLFPAAIYLRIKRPDLPRAFKVPGGTTGMVIVAGTGFVATLFTCFIGFLPPENLPMGNVAVMHALQIGSLVLMLLPFFALLVFKKKSWMPQPAASVLPIEPVRSGAPEASPVLADAQS